MKRKEVEGHEGYYIYEDGALYSIKSSKFLSHKLDSRKHYLMYNLKKRGVSKMVLVHRLVAIAFIPNPKNKPVVNHKDGNKKNNNVSNLEWMTRSENSKHAYDMGLTPKPPSWKGKTGYDHNRSIEVSEIDVNGNIIKYGSMSEASRERSVSIGCIKYSIENSSFTRKGFKYKTL